MKSTDKFKILKRQTLLFLNQITITNCTLIQLSVSSGNFTIFPESKACIWFNAL